MTTDPRLRFVPCGNPGGLYRMAYWEWGDPTNEAVVVCAHGLTRQGRDFDRLAQALQAKFRVVCPDVVGRGRSDWLRDPQGYVVPTYVADALTLLAGLRAKTLYWVGTSLGGLIGMALASLPGSPIARLVLNDVGPQLEFDALQRIGDYVGLPVRFASVEDGVAYLWRISTDFGPHSDEDWRALSEPMLVRDASDPEHPEQRLWRLHYDPAIGEAFRAMTPAFAAQAQTMAWAAFDAIRCPTLLIRGEHSDLLSAQTAMAMTQRGPRAILVECPGVGHAPTFVDPAHIAWVTDFF